MSEDHSWHPLLDETLSALETADPLAGLGADEQARLRGAIRGRGDAEAVLLQVAALAQQTLTAGLPVLSDHLLDVLRGGILDATDGGADLTAAKEAEAQLEKQRKVVERAGPGAEKPTMSTGVRLRKR